MKRASLLAIALLLQCSFSTSSAQSNAGQQSKPLPTTQPSATTQQAPAGNEDVVRITTNLVQIDAAVTDKSGRQITDLRAEDFQVLQDGRPQKITSLSYIATHPVSSQPAVNSNTFPGNNTPPAPNVPLRPEQVHRTIALVVDDLGLSFVSTAFVRKTLTRFVNEQMQPDDLVAIIRSSAGAGALQQFTSDKRQLLAAVEQIRWYPMGRGAVSAFAPIEPNPTEQAANGLGGSSGGDRAAEDARKMSAAAESDREELGQLREETFAVGTLGAINYVLRGLEKLPGRKSVILVSDGFKLFTPVHSLKPQSNGDQQGMKETNAPGSTPNSRILEALRRLTDAANRASVIIYTMDMRGLQTLTLTAEDNVSGASPDRLEAQLLDRKQQFIDTQAGLAYLARLTGGLAIQNENDFNKGIQRVLDDQAGYYLIGYRPDESTFDPTTGRANFHKITVKVDQPGLKIRSRSGFFGIADSETRERKAANGLADMLASPFGAAGVHLRLTSLFGNDDQVGSLMSSALYIDGHDLTFTVQPDGWHAAEMEVAAYTFGAFGEVVDSMSRTHKIRARGDVYDSILRNGLLYNISVPIKKPGAYQLRIAVRDSGSKRVGIASQFIEVPNLSKDRLALSGIFLSGLDPRKINQKDALSTQTEDGDDAQAIPALRRLKAGMEMHYAYYIYNAKLDVAKHPQLVTQVRLFHDGQLAYEGKVMPYDVGPELDLKRLRAGGLIKLSAQAAPGAYILQIIVTDKLAGEKRNTATGWIDFEIVKSVSSAVTINRIQPTFHLSLSSRRNLQESAGFDH